MLEADATHLAQEALGYQFNDLSLLDTALTHASVADARVDSNERQEFLGDAVLDMVVCAELFERYPSALEGDLTKIKSAVVSGKTCAKVGADLKLTTFMRLGKGIAGRQRMPASVTAAVYEACVAAIFLDGGMEAARRFILKHMGAFIDKAANSQHQSNFKSQLQQHAQQHFEATPTYQTLDEQGPDHSKCFEIAVVIGDRQFPGAWGPSKKEAEQLAAARALRELDVYIDPSDPSDTEDVA